MLTHGIPPEFRGGVHTMYLLKTAIRHRVNPEFIGSRNCVPMAFTKKKKCRESAGTGRANLETVPNECYQILRHARGQGNVHFPCSADHEQDWQPYSVDPYSAICDDHNAFAGHHGPINMRFSFPHPLLI